MIHNSTYQIVIGCRLTAFSNGRRLWVTCTPREVFFFFNDTAPPEIYTLSLHDPLPIYRLRENVEALAGTLPGSVIYPCDVASDGEIGAVFAGVARDLGRLDTLVHSVAFAKREDLEGDRKSTRLNSSHVRISYAVFCLKK